MPVSNNKIDQLRNLEKDYKFSLKTGFTEHTI